MSARLRREAVRRFLAGESVAAVAWHLRVPRPDVEQALRKPRNARRGRG